VKRAAVVMMLRIDEISLRESDAWIVKLAATLRLAPRTKHVVKAWVDCQMQQPAPQVICVEVAWLPMEGVLVARAVCGSEIVSPNEGETGYRDRTFEVSRCFSMTWRVTILGVQMRQSIA
jgi:hypothetical protein